MFAFDPRRAAAQAEATRDPDGGRPMYLPGARAIETLSARSCRWPLGEVDDEDFRFCGQLRTRGSYCAEHAGMSGRGNGR